jgi:hypothetical protein
MSEYICPSGVLLLFVTELVAQFPVGRTELSQIQSPQQTEAKLHASMPGDVRQATTMSPALVTSSVTRLCSAPNHPSGGNPHAKAEAKSGGIAGAQPCPCLSFGDRVVVGLHFVSIITPYFRCSASPLRLHFFDIRKYSKSLQRNFIAGTIMTKTFDYAEGTPNPT